MIKPTIGRRVWYWPSDYDLGLCPFKPSTTMAASDRAQPCDAGIAYVHGDRLVNLAVADHNGVMHARTSVALLQDDDARAPGVACAQWMPYQQGQAKPLVGPAIAAIAGMRAEELDTLLKLPVGPIVAQDAAAEHVTLITGGDQ